MHRLLKFIFKTSNKQTLEEEENPRALRSDLLLYAVCPDAQTMSTELRNELQRWGNGSGKTPPGASRTYAGQKSAAALALMRPTATQISCASE